MQHETERPRPGKRQRYTLVACTKCKKRKIKCSGETPCRQCAKQRGTVCVYDRERIPSQKPTLPLLDIEKQRALGFLGARATPDQLVLRSHTLYPLSWSESIELLDILREDVETLYPFIDLEEVKSLLDIVYNSAELPLSSPALDRQTLGWDDIQDSRNLDFLKILLACALSSTGIRDGDPGQRFVLAVEENNYRRWRCMDADFKDVAISTMLSVYDFRHDNLKLAWRKISSAAKLCLELGLHRTRDPETEDPATLHAGWETKMFWCVYVLDRRYSFMANLPFTLQDRDIDINLLQPDKSAPYLLPMVMYGRLGAKIIPAVPKFGFKYDRLDENIRRDFGSEIDQWAQATPVGSSLTPSSVALHSNLDSRRLQHFSMFFKIRSNQMRLSLYKHSLYTPRSVQDYQKFANLAVQLATDNILLLSQPRDAHSSNYESQSLQLRFFLVSSLLSLHLAIRNAPQQFSGALLEYSSGLQVLKSTSVSFTSKKMWKTIQILENALSGLRLGPVHLWGNSLPPQLSYVTSPISETGCSPSENTTYPEVAAESIDIDWSQSEDFALSPTELLPPMSVAANATPNTLSSAYNSELPAAGDINHESKFVSEGTNLHALFQDLPVDVFGVNDFWNVPSGNFWDGEVMVNKDQFEIPQGQW